MHPPTHLAKKCKKMIRTSLLLYVEYIYIIGCIYIYMYLASCMYQIHTCWLPEKGFSMSMTKNKSKKHIYMFVLKKCYIITFLYIVVFLCLCSRYVIQIDITCQSSRRTCMRTPGEGIPFDAIQNSKPVVAGISSGLSHPYGTSKLDQIF